MQVEIYEYTSDFTFQPRFALKVDGRFPPELDFDCLEDAEAAMALIVETP